MCVCMCVLSCTRKNKRDFSRVTRSSRPLLLTTKVSEEEVLAVVFDSFHNTVITAGNDSVIRMCVSQRNKKKILHFVFLPSSLNVFLTQFAIYMYMYKYIYCIYMYILYICICIISLTHQMGRHSLHACCRIAGP